MLRTQTVSGPVTSPNGEYAECFKVHQEETTIDWIQTAGFNPETTVTVRNIWLAPDVGMVALESADSVLTLTSYTTGEE